MKGLEGLEARRLLAVTLDPNGQLNVIGTSANDAATVSKAAAGYLVVLNGVATSISGNVVRILVDGQAGNDTLRVADSVLIPATLSGGDGGDSLYGGGAASTMKGGAGNDTMDGAAGPDVFEGGTGNDTANYSSRTVNLTIGIGTVADDGAAGEKDNLKTDIETLLSGSGNDKVVGSVTNNLLSGGGGNDSIFGNTGNDTMIGGDGNDTLNAVAGDDSLDGGAGDDIFLCGLFREGADNMIGGGGRDTVDYSQRTLPLRVYADGLNNDGDLIDGEHDNVQIDVENIIGGQNGDDLRGGENVANLIDGQAGKDYVRSSLNDADVKAHKTDGADDTLIGGDGDDYLDTIFSRADQQLFGGDGNDRLRVGYGKDLVDGGSGSDTVSYNYRGITSGNIVGNVRISLDGVADDGETNEGDNVLANVENAVTGSGHDTLIGNSADNILSGERGNDVIQGLDGNDVLDGGTGADNLAGGGGDDVFVNADGVVDTIDGGTGHDFAEPDSPADMMKSIEFIYDPAAPAAAISAFAIARAPAPPGGSLVNGVLTLSGTSSPDAITLVQDATKITVTQNTVTKTYTLSQVKSISIDAAGGNDIIALQKADGTGVVTRSATIVAGSGNDSVIGGSAKDVISGGTGSDTVVGGGGDDTIAGDESGDRLDGGSGHDSITGGLGNDRLNGQDGNDKLNGGTNDFYATGDGADVLIGGAGSGDYAIYSNRTVNLVIDIANGTLANDGAAGEGDNVAADIEHVLGGTANDRITGNLAANLLSGGGGLDSLYGGAGLDRLIGSRDRDTISGETDIDFFFLEDGVRDDFDAPLDGAGISFPDFVRGDLGIDYSTSSGRRLG